MTASVNRWRCDAELCAPQMESLWDAVLPVEVRELPEDLARLDRIMTGGLLLPIAEAWEQTARERGARRSRWLRSCG